MRPQLPALLAALFAAPLVAQDDAAAVSFHRDVRPLLMARCAGCHQPAKPAGDVVLTSYGGLLLGQEDEFPLVVPGDPDRSLLVQVVEPWKENPPEMPAEGDPLAEAEVAMLRRWIAAGAADDSPASTATRPTAEAPPVYTSPPVISGVAFSPDGHLLAVTGRHEVLLHELSCGEAVGTALASRLVGLSERVESVAFSPDGSRLAVTGGAPARMGEVQIWDVATGELALSVPATFDAIRGVCWSPDGGRVAVGCGDDSVRVFDTETGEQLFFNAAHEDWVLGTAFSTDGSHLLSISRDRSLKLYLVESEQFIDNVTSITPGALKGGLMAITRHPERDEVLVGGADGVPKVYRVFREKKRVIGDDYNLIREYEGLGGRVCATAWSPAGDRVYAGASVDGAGRVRAYAEDGTVQWTAELPTPVYSLAVHPGGGRLAAAGFDGQVRLLDAETGAVAHAFVPVPISEEPASTGLGGVTLLEASAPLSSLPEALEPAPVGLESIEVMPEVVALDRRAASVQLLLTGVLADGTRVDVTRAAALREASPLATFDGYGLIRPLADGESTLALRVGALELDVPLVVTGQDGAYVPGFRRDVMPIVSRAGCNAGTCHGSGEGKNGFALSLRGYDPELDHVALTDDLASRRVDLAAPAASLFVLKPTAGVPHQGGMRLDPASRDVEVLRDWVAAGASFDAGGARVVSIALLPRGLVVPLPGMSQQMRVLATYSDGAVRDVSALAFLSTSDTEITSVSERGLVTALRRGEASIMARYEGSYDATRLIVMGDREGFAWNDEPSHGWIDDLVHEKQRAVRVLPSPGVSDADFLRRLSLDLTGRIPLPEEVRTFLLDGRDPRTKREEMVDRLIGGPAFVEHWANRWADLLQVNREALGDADTHEFRDWIRAQVASNRPYDEFVREVLTGVGSPADDPPAAWFRTQREPDVAMESTTQLFLGVRFSCNKCHDHPFERWTQDQHWELAAYFGRTEIEMEGPERVVDRDSGELEIPDTGEIAAPSFPFVHAGPVPNDAPRREQLAAWVTAPENPYFARSYVNRVWGYLLGAGLIEPVDDIRASNPPSNAALLDRLTSEFVGRGFDTRWLLREICASRAYQRSVETNEWNADDSLNYTHALPRRLPAEVLYDAVHAAAGSRPSLPDMRPGQRAAQIPGGGVDSPDGFLTLFGRPPRESACECERSDTVSMGQALNLVNGPTVAEALRDPEGAIAELCRATDDRAEIVDELFVRFLSRPPTPDELAEFGATLDPMQFENATALSPDQHADYARRLSEWEAQQLPLAEWAAHALAEGTRSVGGATLTRTEDGALLLSGESPEKDTLVLVAVVDRPVVTGLRLEVLPDPSFPAGGPGRAENGNFVLNELTATAVPLLDPGSPRQLAFSGASADFSQSGWDVAGAIDGNPTSGWAVSPRFGVPHEAVFELAEDLSGEGGVLLVVKFDHQFGTSHTIGKLRLSLTDSARPVRHHALPGPVLEALRVSPGDRSEAHSQALHAHYLRSQPDLLQSIELGATQDLAWALTNSPAFLFNR